MAEVVGNKVNRWWCILNYSTSEDRLNFTINANAQMRSDRYGYQVRVTGTATINGQSTSGSGSFSSGTGQTVTTTFASRSATFAKRTSAYQVGISAQIVNGSGFHDGTSSAYATITIPGLEHHIVKYDANGGTGAPPQQDKYYGIELHISSVKPTREGYTFLGWATSSTGGVVWNPGDNYTPDENVTLYAVWKRNYISPSIMEADAYRVSSSSSTTESTTGEYGYAKFSWKVDTTLTPNNTAKSVTIQYRETGATLWSNVTVSGGTTGTSGTAYGRISSIETGSSYEVMFSITDNSGQTGSTTNLIRTIPVAYFPLSIGGMGRGIGLLSGAPDEGIRLGGNSIEVLENIFEMANVQESFSIGKRFFKEIWTGTVSKGGDIIVPELPNYILLAASEMNPDSLREEGIMLIGCKFVASSKYIHFASQNDDGTSSYVHKASFSIDTAGTKMHLISSSKHILSSTGHTGYDTAICRIYGII